MAQLSYSFFKCYNFLKKKTIFLFQENGLDFEASVVAQCDALVNFIQQRKAELIEAITTEMNSKIQMVKEQMTSCDKKFQSVAGVLQYGHECLQETDAASFLLVRNIRLINIKILLTDTK